MPTFRAASLKAFTVTHVMVDCFEGEDAMQQTSDEDVKRVAATSASENLLPEVVELSALKPELSSDTGSETWLSRLLRYDTENASDSNSTDS